MTTRTVTDSDLKSIPFSLSLRVKVVPVVQAEARHAEEVTREEDAYTEEIRVTAGCMRGLRWALGIEAAVAFIVYGIWHVVQVWR